MPALLWLNTGVLVVSSVALHRAQVAAHRGRIDGVQDGLFAGGVLALAFLAGQLVAWRELDAAGYFLASNPANSFFYLLTAVHGLHVARRPGRFGQGDRQGLARPRRGPGASQRRAVRDLLALPPVRVAGSLRAAAASLEGTGSR